MATIITHVAILATSLVSLAASVISLVQHTRTQSQVTRIEVLVNGERARTTQRLEELSVALAAAGIAQPARGAIPGASGSK